MDFAGIVSTIIIFGFVTSMIKMDFVVLPVTHDDFAVYVKLCEIGFF